MFNQKLDQNELYSNSLSLPDDKEKEKEFINDLLITIVYKHEKTDVGMISVRQIENIQIDLFINKE